MKRILGIDIGGSSVKMGLLNESGGVGDVTHVESITHDAPKLVERIAAAAVEFSPDLVGVGTTGAVNFKTGTVNAGNLAWRNVPLRAMMEESLQKPVWVDNDAKSAMMAEAHSGVCKGARSAVFITLGTGLGGGLIIDGKPWRGDDNTAFELGHIITRGCEYDATGKTKAGRYEYYCSSQALERMNNGRPAREVIEGVLANEAKYTDMFDRFIYDLALGIFTINELFKPDVVALGGGICVTGDYLLNGVRKTIAEIHAHRDISLGEKIKLAVHQNNAGMIGAAALAGLYLS